MKLPTATYRIKRARSRNAGRMTINGLPNRPIRETLLILDSRGAHLGLGRTRVTLVDNPAFPGQLCLEAVGPNVRGYLMDPDGLELSQSDLDDLLTVLLAPQHRLEIEGHSPPMNGHIACSQLTAWLTGGELNVVDRRIIIRPDGGIEFVSHDSHLSANEATVLAFDRDRPELRA